MYHLLIMATLCFYSCIKCNGRFAPLPASVGINRKRKEKKKHSMLQRNLFHEKDFLVAEKAFPIRDSLDKR